MRPGAVNRSFMSVLYAHNSHRRKKVKYSLLLHLCLRRESEKNVAACVTSSEGFNGLEGQKTGLKCY
jgi:hypothetical protein